MQALPGSSVVERLTEAPEAKAPSFDHVNQNVARSNRALAAKYEFLECKKHGLTKHRLRKSNKCLRTSYQCIACDTEWSVIRHKRIKQRLVAAFGGKCSICGYNRSNAALDFHHENPEQKEGEITKMNRFDKAFEEAKKCILVCANCHREIHEREFAIQDFENSTGT